MPYRSQHLLTEGPLLDANGHLVEAGYATNLCRRYDRSAVRAGKTRIKEWDYYLVTGDEMALALTIADNSYMGLDSVSLLWLGEKPHERTKSMMRFAPMGRTGLPADSARGDVQSAGKNYRLRFHNDGAERLLTAHLDDFQGGKPLDAEIRLTAAPRETMVIATPFAGKPKHFYYNQKINCMRARGEVTYDGRTYVFDPEDSFAVLDWGRGVWTYKNTWYWGSASGAVDGVRFGWNIGYGFGNTSAASENMLFYNGKSHKLDEVTFNIPVKNGKDDYMSPWTFTSNDGRFEMNFTPILDRQAPLNVGVICMLPHQVFGKFNGKAILDDGTVIEVKDMIGFAEKVHNKW